MPMRSRFWTCVQRLVLTGLCGAMAGCVVIFYYFSFVDTVAPVRPLGGDHAVNPQVPRGAALLIVRNYCVERPPLHIGSVLPCTVHRRIVDTIVLEYPAVSGPRDAGCATDRVYATELPTLIPNGKYRFEERMHCVINPLTDREVVFPAIEFEIIDEPMPRPRRRADAGAAEQP